MHEPTSAPHPAPVPLLDPTPGEDGRRMAFQAAHPEVGFAPLALCEDPGKRWVAYWWAEEGRAAHVTGPSLGDVLDTLAEEFSDGI